MASETYLTFYCEATESLDKNNIQFNRRCIVDDPIYKTPIRDCLITKDVVIIQWQYTRGPNGDSPSPKFKSSSMILAVPRNLLEDAL